MAKHTNCICNGYLYPSLGSNCLSDIRAIALCPLPGEYYAQILAERRLAVSVALATSMHSRKSLSWST